jgi:hypothetical protein
MHPASAQCSYQAVVVSRSENNLPSFLLRRCVGPILNHFTNIGAGRANTNKRTANHQWPLFEPHVTALREVTQRVDCAQARATFLTALKLVLAQISANISFVPG